eukprot:216818_1
MGNTSTSTEKKETTYDQQGYCTVCNKLISEKDYVTSNFVITTAKGIQHKTCAGVKPENKDDEKSDDNDENEQECVVNETDWREPIYNASSVKDLPIIKCIGQIKTEY